MPPPSWNRFRRSETRLAARPPSCGCAPIRRTDRATHRAPAPRSNRAAGRPRAEALSNKCPDACGPARRTEANPPAGVSGWRETGCGGPECRRTGNTGGALPRRVQAVRLPCADTSIRCRKTTPPESRRSTAAFCRTGRAPGACAGCASPRCRRRTCHARRADPRRPPARIGEPAFRCRCWCESGGPGQSASAATPGNCKSRH